MFECRILNVKSGNFFSRISEWRPCKIEQSFGKKFIDQRFSSSGEPSGVAREFAPEKSLHSQKKNLVAARPPVCRACFLCLTVEIISP